MSLPALRQKAALAFRASFIGAFFASLVASVVSNGVYLHEHLAPRPVPDATPLPAAPPAPRMPAKAPPAPRPMQHLHELPKSLGAAADPRRVQYENHISITQGGRTWTFPAHSGTVDVMLGPVVLTIPAGDSIDWDPTSGLSNIDEEVQAVFAISDVPAQDATHAVTISGTDSIDSTLDPAAYIPEPRVFPLTITNGTDREARVTVIVWTNTDAGGGGGGDV